MQKDGGIIIIIIGFHEGGEGMEVQRVATNCLAERATHLRYTGSGNGKWQWRFFGGADCMHGFVYY